MNKLLTLILACANVLVVNAEREKATFTIVDDWCSPVTNASLKILTPKNAFTLSWIGPIPHSENNKNAQVGSDCGGEALRCGKAASASRAWAPLPHRVW